MKQTQFFEVSLKNISHAYLNPFQFLQVRGLVKTQRSLIETPTFIHNKLNIKA